MTGMIDQRAAAPDQGRAYLHSLTIARGIAAWLVVFYHIRSGMPWIPDGLRAVFAKGYLAVDFFFLLSGFVIYLSAHRAMTREGAAAIRPFLFRRLARIYPLYAVLLACTVVFAIMLTLAGRDTSGYPWDELPLHIVMMQNWGFTEALRWNHPAWSISTEMAAYLLFPLLMLGTPIARASRTALLAVMAALLAIMALWLQSGGLHNLGQYIAQYGLVRCLFEFSAGTCLCAIWLQCGGKREKLPVALAGLVFAAAGLVWLARPGLEVWTFPPMAAALIFLLAELSRRNAGKTGRPRLPVQAMIYLGEISYATYLSHFMLFTWYKIVLVQDSAHVLPWKIGVFLLATLLVSMALYHLVEKPGRQLFARAQGRTDARAVPA
ncbi:MAG: acyltransferase family protein [Sphingobium sp.]